MIDAIAALQARLRTRGGEPLLTHYDADSRVELSATTFANWVDKTTSFIDDLGVAGGTPVWLPVLAQRPDHWTSLVWALACWQFGSPITLVNHPETELAVVPPTNVEPIPGIETVACSLHPLGLGFSSAIAAIDYREVLAMPDVHWRGPQPPALVLDAALDVAPDERRVLLGQPHDALRNVSALVSCLLGGGSLVLVHGGDEAAIAAAEHAELG